MRTPLRAQKNNDNITHGRRDLKDKKTEISGSDGLVLPRMGAGNLLVMPLAPECKLYVDNNADMCV